MTALAYAIGAYRRQTGRLPEQRLVNLFVEAVPQGDEPVVLIPRPGLVSYREAAGPAVRGLYSGPGTFGGAVIAVIGTSLLIDGAFIGTIPGVDRVQIAASESEALIVANGVLYRTDGSAFQTVTIGDSLYVTSVTLLARRFVVTTANSGVFWWSDVSDGTAFDGTSFAEAESNPDGLVAAVRVGDELWLAGSRSWEFWQTTSDADLPFSPIQGRTYAKGAMSRDTIALSDNAVKFVGHDGIVYRAEAGPTRISDHGIEERIEHSEASNLRAWAFSWRGHSFYCLTTDQGTFVFDDATQQWSEFASYGFDHWRAHLGCSVDTDVIAGDSESGTLWRLSDDVATDDGGVIQRVFTAHAKVNGAPVACNSLSIDASVGQTELLQGQGSDPLIEVRFSRDLGNTWTDNRAASLGGQGKYRTRAAWRRLGLIDEPGRVFEFRCSDPVPFRLSGVRMNELGGGLSR